MTEHSARDTILKNTLQMLAAHVDLPSTELVQLRLSHLHLAGKSPHISFTPADSDDPKLVELDLEAHRALVGWLVARPDSKTDFLFPGSGDGPMDPQEIERLVKAGPAAQQFGPEPEIAQRARGGAEPPAPAGDETIISASRPVPPPPARPMPPPTRPVYPFSRPEPPPTRPEMGPPPESVEPAAAPLRPPPSAPEVSDVNIPLPTAAPKPSPPPPAESGEAPGFPADTPGAAPEADQATTDAPPAVGGQSENIPPPPAPAPSAPVQPARAKKIGPAKDRAAAPPGGKAVGVARSKAPLTAEEAAAEAARSGRSSAWSRLIVSGSAVVILLTCLICLGGGWLAAQSGPGQSLLALVGLSSQAEPATAVADSVEPTETVMSVATALTAVFESPLDSPLPTPTETPTTPPTDTPAPPTETATPVPTNTPAPPPTNTPVPTDTPVPTAPVPEEPAETPTPAESPTPAMKYGAPVLVEPKEGYNFIQGNTIVLRWEPVGELAPDEQYAVRMVYRYQNQPTYQGANIKESEWLVPLSLFGQIDGPDNLYEWYVAVERLNDDGSGTPISPESERRTFTWK